MNPRLLLLLSLCLGADAVDVVGAPAWLSTSTAPAWRQARLGEVLTAIATLAGCPLARSAALTAPVLDQQVTLTLPRAQTLQTVLQLLETAQDLHIGAGPGGLTVTTRAQWRIDQRHAVRLDLRDYGALIAFPEPDPLADRRRVPVALMPGPERRPPLVPVYTADAEQSFEYLRSCLGPAGERLTLEEETMLVAQLDDEEEASLRRELAQLVAVVAHSRTWSATFAVVAAAGDLPTGIVPAATAAALRQRLSVRKQLRLTTRDLHVSRAADQHQQELLTMAQCQAADGMEPTLLPIAEVLTTGWSCELRPIVGQVFLRLGYRLSWSEPRPGATAALLLPAPAPSAEVPHPVGQSLTLAKPAVWSWEPQGEVFLLPGQALVLVAPHAEGRALIVLAEEP